MKSNGEHYSESQKTSQRCKSLFFIRKLKAIKAELQAVENGSQLSILKGKNVETDLLLEVTFYKKLKILFFIFFYLFYLFYFIF